MLDVLIIVLCCGALWKGAGWLVDGAARIAKSLGVSPLVIGLTVVAFGTSAPEFAVTVQAAINHQPDMAVGNVIGSNVFNIGLILGVCSLFMTIKTSVVLVLRDGLLLLATMVGVLLMLLNHELARWQGVLLVCVLVAYLLVLFRKREQVMEEEVPAERATKWDVVRLLVGLVLVMLGGKFMVVSAGRLAAAMGMSETVIALTVVAAGTSLPELAISMVALVKKEHAISAGNLVGSNLFNTLGVLGVAGAIRPLAVDDTVLVSVVGQVVLTALVVVFMWTSRKVTRWEGVVLVLVSLAIWGYSIRAGMGVGG